MQPAESPISAKTHDMLEWLFRTACHFPKLRRHSLTEKIETTALDLLECLITANALRRQARADRLRAGDAKLQTLEDAATAGGGSG